MDDSPPPSRFLRQYALTQGRVRSLGIDLALDTLVQVSAEGRTRTTTLPNEQAAVLLLADEPVSIAEISAHLRVHLGVARVLVSDLCATGSVAVSTAEHAPGGGPDLETLERLLDDLTIF
jgi:hypothetical protein